MHTFVFGCTRLGRRIGAIDASTTSDESVVNLSELKVVVYTIAHPTSIRPPRYGCRSTIWPHVGHLRAA